VSDVRLTRDTFYAGEDLEGVVELDPNEEATLTVSWSTSGKGDSDSGVAHRESYRKAPDARTIRLSTRLPLLPLSYDGRLIKLWWRVTLDGATRTEAAFVLACPPAEDV
jgi:hypothetical protein